MKMNKKLLSIISIISLGILLCGVWRALNYLSLYDFLLQRFPSTRCTLPPEGFSENDLVGTWFAGDPSQNDTLIIKNDGKYKQLIHVEFVDFPDIEYESEWQSWHLEYAESGIPYLHLDGMRFCGINPDINCNQTDGDGYDFCKNENIKMPEKGILLVLGVRKDFIQSSRDSFPLRGINLWFPLGSENTWVYSLQQP